MKKKILIVDDDVNVSSMIGEFLDRKGFTAITALNGDEGLKAAVEHEPDLILLDICMPKVNGFNLLLALKLVPMTNCIPVIMITGKTDEESRLKASRLGSQDYLVKPFQMEELESRVMTVLKEATAQPFNPEA